jgi:hypothetical protein
MKEKPSDQKKKNPTGNTKSKQPAQPSGSLFDHLDSYLSKSYSWLIWVIPGIALLFSLFLFDQRISQAGDDSFYIIRAYEFVHSFKYPAFQGPLYPMVLGLVVAIFGISLIPLKIVSLLAMLAFIFLVFKVMKTRVPPTILVATMLAISVNSYLLYYASQTYNEAFYLFVQALLLLVFFTRFIDHEKADTWPAELKRHLLLACCLLAITLSKNIGFSAIIAVFGYFVLKGQWKNLLISILAFGAVFIVFQGIRYALWREEGLQFSTQASGLLNKDYYNPQNGKEDLAGMFKRFTDNSQLYLSKHFLYMVGLRTYAINLVVSPLATLSVYLLALAGLGLTYKKNAYIFFAGLLAGSFLLISFVILQAKWDQGRLIIPAVSFLILLIFSAIYYSSQVKKLRAFQFVLPLIAFIVFFSTLAATTTQIKKAQEETGRYGGLTPDWKHYIQASEWAADNLPADAVIACRKPSISFVYGKGRNFYGIMQIPSYSLDQFYNDWKKNEHSQVAYSYSDFAGKQLPPGMFDILKKNMVAQYIVGDKFYFIDRLPDSLLQRTINATTAMGISGITTFESLKAITSKASKPGMIIYPDSLLNILLKNKVTHVLTASLRRNSLENTGQTINTVERYIAFVEDKYPGLLNKVTQIGSDDNEPASIIKLEYEKVGISLEKK